MDDFLVSITILFFNEETIQPLGETFTEYLLCAGYRLFAGICLMNNVVLNIYHVPF